MLDKYFEENYELLNNDNEKYPVIEFFKKDNSDELAKPLNSIYIHKTMNEMYLILNCLDYDNKKIEEICSEWELKILEYVNFGDEYQNNKKHLKYNFFLIILHNYDISKDEFEFVYTCEKSLKICRKIFLFYNEDKINENEEAILPFNFSNIKNRSTDETKSIEKKIEELLSGNNKITSILDKDDISDEDFEKIDRWLSKI